jgi:hypothetical protein
MGGVGSALNGGNLRSRLERLRIPGGVNLANRGLPVSSQVRMLSGVEVVVSLALRRRHTDLLEAFSETNALLYPLLSEALSAASSYSQLTASQLPASAQTTVKPINQHLAHYRGWRSASSTLSGVELRLFFAGMRAPFSLAWIVEE